MLYNKIYGPFKRDMETNQVVPGKWSDENFDALQDAYYWHITEKIDGTNVRVIWDGHDVTFGGRTERAEMPKPLVAVLTDLFPEEKFEQAFGERPVILFGEGFGPGIQRGGKYGDTVQFNLFDIAFEGEQYARPQVVEDIAESMHIPHAPVIARGWTLWDAIEAVNFGLTSTFGDFRAEGVVAKFQTGLRDHRGHRLIVKVKDVDLYGIDLVG